MSVIIARALPDVRDGLKPVQRRTLMICMNWESDMTNRIVRVRVLSEIPWVNIIRMEILPSMMPWLSWHRISKGTAACGRAWKFGSIEGDGAAAMRYTEARLQKVTQEAYLADLDKNVVDFMPNFDETEKSRLFCR